MLLKKCKVCLYKVKGCKWVFKKENDSEIVGSYRFNINIWGKQASGEDLKGITIKKY